MCMTVHRRCPSEVTQKKLDTLRRWVSDRHDGCAVRTVEGITLYRRCPSEDTYKNLETLGKRVTDNQNDCTGRNVMGTIVPCMYPLVETQRKQKWGVGKDPMTVRCGYDGPSSGSRFVFSDKTGYASIIPYDSNGIHSVNLHLCNPNTQQTSNANAPFSRVLTMQFEDSQPMSLKICSKNKDPPKRNRLIRIKKQKCYVDGQRQETHT